MKKHIILIFCGKGIKKSNNKSTGSILTADINLSNFNMKLTGSLDNMEKSLIRITAAAFLMFMIYAVFSLLLVNGIDKKTKELSDVKSSVEKQITLANNDLTKLQTKTSAYKRMRTELESINEKMAESYRTKNEIPNLLYHIMNIIPVNVQITSIENTIDKHIVINAQTTDYQYLAYFTAGLKNGGILTNVVSGTAVKNGEIIKVTIEGDLQ